MAGCMVNIKESKDTLKSLALTGWRSFVLQQVMTSTNSATNRVK